MCTYIRMYNETGNAMPVRTKMLQRTRMHDRQRDRQTDRQAGRQTDGQTDRQTDRQTERQAGRQTQTHRLNATVQKTQKPPNSFGICRNLQKNQNHACPHCQAPPRFDYISHAACQAVTSREVPQIHGRIHSRLDSAVLRAGPCVKFNRERQSSEDGWVGKIVQPLYPLRERASGSRPS